MSRILMVEDDDDIGKLAGLLLKRAGFEVVQTDRSKVTKTSAED
ncbi:MAG: hypothetical protein NUW37_14455 [Planctomycetes bacterium]|nr:hypothetical protein [Planctomycetota bacterium]